MSMKFKNNSGSKLANDILATATGFTVLAGTGSNFPELTSNKDYFHVTLVGDDGDMEIVRVTKVEGDVLTCIRAQEDTVAKDWPAGTRVENRITAEFLNQVATGDTIKFDQKTIKTNIDGISAVDPAQVYGTATESALGVVKIDNATITINDAGTISADPSSLVAESGPDNYLEVVDDKLVVRGVQTSKNLIMSGSGTSITKSSTTINNSSLALTRINNFTYPTAAFPANNADIATVHNAGSTGSECTVFTLKPGTYHFGAMAHNTSTQGSIIRLFKKEGLSWVVASIGSYSGAGSQQESAHFDAHFTIDEVTDFTIGFGAGSWNFVEVTIQKFADASLLAPALMQSRSQIYSCYLQGISREEALSVEGGFWHPIGFDSVNFPSFQLPADNIVTPVKHASTASKTDAFKILADGIYHLQIWTYYQSTAEEDQVSASVYIYKNGDSTPYQLNAETADINGVGYYNHVNIDAHIRLEAGDIVVFCGGTVNNSNIVSAKVYIQLFPDTLSHPNHGVSQDAGNMAQVGSDLGVYVPDISGVNTGEIYSEDLGQVSLINSSTSDQIQFSSITQGTDMTHPNLFSMSASSSDADTYTDFVCNADGTYHLKCTIPLTNVDTQYSQYFKSYIKVTRNGSPIQIFVTDEYLWSSSTKYFDLCGIVNLKIGDVITLHTYAQYPSTMSLSTAEVVFCRIASLAPDVSDLDIEIPTATTTTTGITRLATNAQAVAGTESGAYALNPATGKANAISSVINELGNEESNLYTTITNVAGDIVSDAVTNSTSDIYNSINQVVEASNAGTATKLKTARTISLTGNATGSATFDGSANAAIAVTVSEASNAGTWGGSTKYVSTAAASGGAAGDIWFQYV